MMFHLFEKRKKFLESTLPMAWTDIHSHILPGVDDGSKTEEESLQILDYLEHIGTERLYLTPHVMSDLKKNNRLYLEERFNAFKVVYQGGIELRLGAEYMLDEKFMNRLGEKPLTYEDNHILVETSYLYSPPDFGEMLYEMILQGYVPVLAHPERYIYMKETDYHSLKRRGCKFQLNLLSLGGYYGKGAQVCSEVLLEEGLYDFVGSDIHGMRHRVAYEKFTLKKRWLSVLEELKENNRKL